MTNTEAKQALLSRDITAWYKGREYVIDAIVYTGIEGLIEVRARLRDVETHHLCYTLNCEIDEPLISELKTIRGGKIIE